MDSQGQWQSGPYSSQAMLPSIEEQIPIVWTQPLGPPSQGPAYTAVSAPSNDGRRLARSTGLPNRSNKIKS